MDVVVVVASQNQPMVLHAQLLATSMVQAGDPATVAHGMLQFGCNPLFKGLPIACPDPTPDDHHCLKPLPCPKCKNSTSMDVSSPPSTLQKPQFQFHAWESVNIVAPISHPEPPHVCKEIPCSYCGRRVP